MIIVYLNEKTLRGYEIRENNTSLLKNAIWIDVLEPTRKEELLLEKKLNLDIPTREEMSEIELSSRLYKKNQALFMTASMIAQSESPNPKHDAITFILTKKQLVTIRYIEPQAFRLFISRLHAIELHHDNASAVLMELLEATIDRLADILEIVACNLENFSKLIFRPAVVTKEGEKSNFKYLVQEIGANADLNTKARDCLVSFSRLISFFGQSAGPEIGHEGQGRLNILNKDISSLSDHASFISSKSNFLLDATLGMINIEQNAIIKILSFGAVIFLPPTLIASIYGMNFKFMPELNYKWGYLIAIGLMFLSAYIPYKYFKYKKWF